MQQRIVRTKFFCGQCRGIDDSDGGQRTFGPVDYSIFMMEIHYKSEFISEFQPCGNGG